MLNAAKLRLPRYVQQSLSIGRLTLRLKRQLAGECLRYSRERFRNMLFRRSLCDQADDDDQCKGDRDPNEKRIEQA